jgi:hypothetical protein
MATYDKRFEIVRPTSWEHLIRATQEVADKDLLNPNVSGKVPLIDGEFVTENSEYKLIRPTSNDVPAYAYLEWRGALEVQASGKAAVVKGGPYEADTIVFDSTGLALHSRLMQGDVTVGGGTRRGLLLRTASNLVIGYVTKLPAINGGRLRFVATAF